MIHTVEIYFLLFFAYAILGWIMEVVLKLISQKKFINRGFLIGPYCPIYGYGVLLITFLLRKYQNDFWATFIFSIFICGVLEYITSYLLEKIFHARWWDYSNKKFNINGRICLETLIPFGIMGCLIIYVTNPIIIDFLNKLPSLLIHITSIALFMCYIVDNVISCRIIFNLREISTNLMDNTEEISKKVKNIITKKSILHRRLIEAFPNLKAKVNLKEWLTKKEEKIKKLRKSK